jgi:hypothetical protein
MEGRRTLALEHLVERREALLLLNLVGGRRCAGGKAVQ